jgi:hypothetical protein
MKKRYLILIGAVLGWAVVFVLFIYGNQVLKDASAEFKGLIQTNTGTIIYKAPGSDSKIAILWAEKEAMPWKNAITVRVGSPKEKNSRQIIFQKQ